MRKRFGIRARFILILVLITLIPLLITGYILTKINEESIKVQTKEFQLSVSIQLTELTHSILNNSCSELSEISQILSDTNLSTDQVLRLTSYKVSNSKNIQSVNIHNIEGAFVDSLAASGNDLKTFTTKKIPADLISIIREGKCVPGRFFSTGGRIYLQIFKSWKTGEKLQGYFQVITEITGLSSQLKDIIHKRSFPRFDSAYIIDRNFNMVANSDWTGQGDIDDISYKKMISGILNQRALPSKNIGIAFDFFDGKTEWLVNINTISRLNWILVTLQEKSKAYESLYSLQKKILLIALIFILIAGLIGALLGTHLSSPILKIAKGARILAENKFSHRIKDIRSGDEIGEVASAFNHLGESLEEYDARIKKEVAIRSDLSRYLTPELVESIIDRKADLELGGKKQKIAVLFADIAGFTSIAESKPPEQVVSLLNELFTILTGIIFRNNGMIDKFIGDSVMALFGIPDSDPAAVDHAVSTAKEMRTWLEVGNKKWRKDLGINIELSISINYGEVIVGNIGSESRMEFTAIGDVVNTAAKVEKIALADQILITEEVYNILSDKKNVRPAGEFKISGHEENARLFEIL